MKKISVFTPSHRPEYLDECYQSLTDQTYNDWEWVVVTLPGLTWAPPKKDDRVRVLTSDHVGKGVGAAKAYTVEQCKGEILVELDHDDVLMPTALERIVDAFNNHPNASLVYSDFSQINADGSPNFDKFGAIYGWKYHMEDPYLVCEAMEPTPHNVSYIWYEPNHVRAFTRKAYDKAGRYNSSLTVLDDQDIIMRLYEVGEFVRIPELLYLQRMHDTNTQKQKDTNAFIQTDTVRQYDAGIGKMALAWAKRNKLKAIELGCGNTLAEGYEGFDLTVEGKNITKHDLSTGITLPDNSVGVVRAVDFLEHLPHAAGIMKEIHRVLAPNGLLLSLTPSTDGRGAFQDPTHVSFWNENSVWYWTNEKYAEYSPQNNSIPKFQVSKASTYCPTDWHVENKIPYLQMNLIAVKKGYIRDGGPLLWSDV